MAESRQWSTASQASARSAVTTAAVLLRSVEESWLEFGANVCLADTQRDIGTVKFAAAVQLGGQVRRVISWTKNQQSQSTWSTQPAGVIRLSPGSSAEWEKNRRIPPVFPRPSHSRLERLLQLVGNADEEARAGMEHSETYRNASFFEEFLLPPYQVSVISSLGLSSSARLP